MKITKQRLQQIIQEEINSHKAQMPSLNEGIDIEDVRYVEELAQSLRNVYGAFVAGFQPDLRTPQTRDGLPVTGENAHEEAKEAILETIGEVIDTFEEGNTDLNEDGHTDIPSAARKMKLAIEDAGQILAALESGQGDLPSWWMSKVTIAADYLNKARDYLLVPSQEMEEKLKPSMGAGAYVDDFRKSKAPQFKGKSDKKKQKMAIAAYLDDKEEGK